MARGGWQVRERKARQAAKASRITAPLLISLPPTQAIAKLTPSYPNMVPFPSNTSASESVPPALLVDSSPRPLEFSASFAPTAAVTTTPARPSTPVPPLAPSTLNDTLNDGSFPPAIAAAATASSTSSAPVNPAASIHLSPSTTASFDAVISARVDPSFLPDPAPEKKLNRKARRKIAAAAALESNLIGELSEGWGDASLAQFYSKQPPTSEESEQAAAAAEQLGAEMRQLFLLFPDLEGYESDEKGEAPQQQHSREEEEEAEGYESNEKEEASQQPKSREEEEEEAEGYKSNEKGEALQQEEEEEEGGVLERITAKITTFWQAPQFDAKDPLQNYGELQSRQNQREKELEEALIQAEIRIADIQSHIAQAHEDLFSFMTDKLAKQEEASKKASHAAARIIALLIFCNCLFLGLLIAPYL